MPFVFDSSLIDAPRGEYMQSIKVSFSGGSAPGGEELEWVLRQDGVVIDGPHVVSWFPPNMSYPSVIPVSAELGPATVEVTPSTAGPTISKEITIVNSPPTLYVSSDNGGLITSVTGTEDFEFTADLELDVDSSISERYWVVRGPSSFDVIEDDVALETTLSGYGYHYVNLVTMDSEGSPTTALLRIRVNQRPIAVIAPASGTIHRTVPFDLDGTGSSDDEDLPDDAFFWRVVSGPGVPIDGIYPPGGGAVTITGDAYGPEPTFTFNNNGNYVVELTVVDWDGALSTPVTRTFTVVT